MAPPLPKRSAIAEFRVAAKIAGKKLYRWQDIAGRYITATHRDRWLFPEICLVVARQNGKTTLLVPRIVMGLLRGERIMHTAQDRSLPREVFVEVVDLIAVKYPELLKGRPRLANGQEAITMKNGGRYKIVAPTRSGARGPSNDLVIIDEARELTDFEFIAAAVPTLTVSPNPQRIYLSNAGEASSVVLNALKKRAEADTTLGYVEWSAKPERPVDDRTGWREANPSLADGAQADAHWRFLEDEYAKHARQGTLAIFETEHLCRWVDTTLPRLVSEIAWERARRDLPKPNRPALGIAADPAGRRASAVIAWMHDGLINVHLLADYTGYPIDLPAIAAEVLPLTRKLAVREVGYDAWTDREFARHFRDPKPINPADYERGSEVFQRAIESGQLRHDDRAELSADIAYTVRKQTVHGWVAVPASSDRPTTASLAAVRAVWLATVPPKSKPQVY